MTLNLRPLPKELQTIAENELFENSDRIQSDVNALRAWLKKCPYIIARTDDQHLVNFLRSCKYSLERTKEKLEMHYTLKTLFPEVIKGHYPVTEKMLNIIRLGVVVPLPLEHPGAPRIILTRFVYDPNVYDAVTVFQATTLMQEILLYEDDNSIIAGQINIVDNKDLSMGHMKHFDLPFVKKLTVAFQDGSAVRIKGLHYINMPSFVMAMFNIFKGFLNAKVRSRIFMHSGMDELFDILPKRLFPAEYGGEAGTVSQICEGWVNKIKERELFFKEQEALGTDESKRPGKPKTNETLFGLDGSFKQLDYF